MLLKKIIKRVCMNMQWNYVNTKSEYLNEKYGPITLCIHCMIKCSH